MLQEAGGARYAGDMSAKPTCCCPRDGALLDSGTFHGVDILLCPTCQGTLVKQKRMNGLLDEMSKELQRTIPLESPLDRISDKGPNVACPVCERQMENYGYMGADFVIVDACHACRLLWLDTYELGAMSVQFARTTRRVDVMRMRQEASRLERARMAESIDIAKVVAGLMVTAFVTGKVL